MRKETWSIMLACALGAFIGALFAIEIQSRFALGSYLWPFGALLGGIIAWCAVDFKPLCSGIARSYRVSAMPGKFCWKAAIAWILGFWSLAGSSTALCIALIFFIGTPPVNPSLSWILVYTIPMMLWSVSLAGILVFIVLSAIFPFICFQRKNESKSEYEERMKKDIKTGFGLLDSYNPISLLILVIRFSSLAVRFVGREIGRFVARVFIYVHSERRTLCFVDATLGAGIGFFCGSAIIGVVAGAALGVVNYELVSVRWLKLVPNKAR